MKLRNVLCSFVMIGLLMCGSLQVKAAGADRLEINNNNNYSEELIEAISVGNIQEVKRLIEQGADTNQTGKMGTNPLILAVGKGRIDIVKLLLDNNANVNRFNWDGNTALIVAVRNDHMDIVKLLCDTSINVYMNDENGKTALDYAIYRENKEMIKAIKRHLLPPKNCGMNNKN